MSNYLPLIVRDTLLKTDWTENEVAAYSALLEKGAMGLTDLSTETGVPVSTLQYVIKQLTLKKMLTKNLVNGKPVYSASDVEQLRKWVKGYSKQFEQYQEIMTKFVDQYDFNPQMYTPKVRFYEGVKGVKQSYKQMVAECTETEIYACFSVIEEIQIELQNFFVTEYVPERVRKGIKMYNMALETPKAIYYKENDDGQLRETRLLPKAALPLTNSEINLYDDYMHCMSFNEKGAFAMIVKDKAMVSVLKSIFRLLWKNTRHDNIYMTDSFRNFSQTIISREHLFTDDLKERWIKATPKVFNTSNGETILEILGFETMSSYQKPYMEKLAEIVTRNGGDILSIGYGLGIVDQKVEEFRKPRKVNQHYVIELNEQIAKEARKNKKINVIEGDWRDEINNFKGIQFDGIIYDGYPLSLDEIHRDGINFIKRTLDRNLLKKDGILTFYVDAPDEIGQTFLEFLDGLGLELVDCYRVDITPPERERQVWQADHFLAPVVKYKK